MTATIVGLAGTLLALVGVLIGNVVTTQLIAYTRSYDRSFEAISSVYGELTRLHRSFVLWTAPFNAVGDLSEEDREVNNASHFNKFLDVYYPQAIWFDQDLQKLIEEYIETARTFRVSSLNEIRDHGYFAVRADMQRVMNAELASRHEEIKTNLQAKLEWARRPWWQHLFDRALPYVGRKLEEGRAKRQTEQ